MLNLRLEEKTFTYKVTTKPGQIATFSFIFKDGLPLSIRQIRWSYSIPGSVSDGYGWPKTPLRVSIDNLCTDETSSPLDFSNTPVVAPGATGCVKNESHIPVDLCLHFQGLLVMGDVTGLTSEQIALYSTLDTSQRAALAFGMSSPGMPALGVTPAATPALTERAAPALTQRESTQDQESLMAGDLFLASKSGIIPVDAITALSEFLLGRGWKR